MLCYVKCYVCYAMLCNAMLCYIMPCYVMLCHVLGRIFRPETIEFEFVSNHRCHPHHHDQQHQCRHQYQHHHHHHQNNKNIDYSNNNNFERYEVDFNYPSRLSRYLLKRSAVKQQVHVK